MIEAKSHFVLPLIVFKCPSFGFRGLRREGVRKLIELVAACARVCGIRNRLRWQRTKTPKLSDNTVGGPGGVVGGGWWCWWGDQMH